MFRAACISAQLLRSKNINPVCFGCLNVFQVSANPLVIQNVGARHASVDAPSLNESIIGKFLKKVGWMDHNRTRLKLSGYFLYESVPANVDYEKWVEVCGLPDAFSSWFVITELHVWMLMVRCMAEDLAKGQEARYIKDGDGRSMRNAIVEAMWADIANRIKLLQGANPSLARKQVNVLSEQFHAALMSYDEGLSSDKALAAAIWRRFYHMESVDAQIVIDIIKTVRKQLLELDHITSTQLKTKPVINWLSIQSLKR